MPLIDNEVENTCTKDTPVHLLYIPSDKPLLSSLFQMHFGIETVQHTKIDFWVNDKTKNGSDSEAQISNTRKACDYMSTKD